MGKVVAGRDGLKSLRTGEGILTISLFFPVVFQPLYLDFSPFSRSSYVIDISFMKPQKLTLFPHCWRFALNSQHMRVEATETVPHFFERIQGVRATNRNTFHRYDWITPCNIFLPDRQFV